MNPLFSFHDLRTAQHITGDPTKVEELRYIASPHHADGTEIRWNDGTYSLAAESPQTLRERIESAKASPPLSLSFSDSPPWDD